MGCLEAIPESEFELPATAGSSEDETSSVWMSDSESFLQSSTRTGSKCYSVTYKSIETSARPNSVATRDRRKGACRTAHLMVLLKTLAALCLLYLFICSLDLLAAALRLVGGRASGEIFSTPLLHNPIVGVVIGILVTVLVQSSSTSTSLMVSMVTAGYMSVQQVIPMLMGANVGTSITNTLVAFAQVSDRDEFRNAFAAATIHDMFNWMTLLVLLPMEVTTGMLYRLSGALTSFLKVGQQAHNTKFLSLVTEPLVKRIVQLDEDVLEAWSLGNETDSMFWVTTLLRNCSMHEPGKPACKPSTYIFNGSQMSDTAVGCTLLVLSLLLMSLCLFSLVKVLKSMLAGPIFAAIRKTVNFEMEFPFKWVPGYLAILVGAVMTFLVQSSSVFTSALTPLAGMGIITLERMYPLCLGSNVGTTSTAILAALASDQTHLRDSLQAALCHTLFNLFGICCFYVIPFTRVPIRMAKALGETSAQYRWFSIVYLLGAFVLGPLIVLGLSLAGSAVLMAVIGCVFLLVLMILAINAIRKCRPQILPPPFRHGWEFLPKPLRSLEFYDEFMPNFTSTSKTSSRKLDFAFDSKVESAECHPLLYKKITKSGNQSQTLAKAVGTSQSSTLIAMQVP